MKNRLEIARELMRDDGIIIVDIDHFELFYLGVLCDEIFGKDNRLGILAVQHNPGGRDNEFFANSHENKLVYARDKSLATIYNFSLSDEELYKKYDKEDTQGRYYEAGLQRTGDGANREDRPNLFYPIFYSSQNNTISFEHAQACVKILPIESGGVEKRWRWSRNKVSQEWEKGNIIARKVRGAYKLFTKQRSSEDEGTKPKTLWVDSKHAGTNGTRALKEIFSEKVFSYPKSPFMVADTLQIATKPGDLVLDYHLGSGTTAAVAHKMGRQYIGVEQMDYIESIAVARLQKVMAGEQGGISQAVSWHGGGNFVYLELKMHNQTFIERITAATSCEEMLAIKAGILSKADIDYRLDTEAVKQNPEQFAALSLKNQKQVLIDFLELNQLYVPHTERGDARFACTDAEKRVSELFYKR